MKHIISYSGGVGSAMTAQLVCKDYGADNVLMLFADTLVEDKDLYRFNAQVVELLGCEFKSISEGRTPWQVFKDERYIGNTRVDPCSRILKREFIRQYLMDNYTKEEITVWVGYDATESHRLTNLLAHNHYSFRYRSKLVESKIFLTSKLKKDWCNSNGIEIPRLYKLGFPHNNCGGFCVKAGQAQFKLLYKTLPEVYLANEQEEQIAIKNNPNLKPFLRKTIKGELRYLTLKEFREEFLDQGKQIDTDDWGGCGCGV